MSERFEKALVYGILNGVVGFILIGLCTLIFPVFDWDGIMCALFALGMFSGGFISKYYLQR